MEAGGGSNEDDITMKLMVRARSLYASLLPFFPASPACMFTSNALYKAPP
jgi:hypothetical protein